MKIGILTSSRADYGIYRPLLKAFADEEIDFSIIAYGSHLSEKYGETINEIETDGFEVKYKLKTFKEGDSSEAIAKSMAHVTDVFAGFWEKNGSRFDIIFCLGDRYEMFAAVQAGMSFNLRFAHIHGGETTLGAIDNIFRHCITLMADIHFASLEQYAKRVESITGYSKNIYTVGALGLDNIYEINLLTKEQIRQKYDIDFDKPTILFTFHPETVQPERNTAYIKKIISVLENHPDYQIAITGTNADTASEGVRQALTIFANKNADRVFFYESLGTRQYFSFMHFCTFMMGNSSSGIIEAASLGTYVIDLGDRQKGRTAGKNVLRVPINRQKIDEAINTIEKAPPLDAGNIYWQGGAAKQIVEVIKGLK